MGRNWYKHQHCLLVNLHDSFQAEDQCSMAGNKKGNKQYGRNAAKDKSTDSKKNKKKGMARRKKAVI
jgi:hypothetical protein